jgi:hypothetical protein
MSGTECVYERDGNCWQQNTTASGPQPQLSFNSATNQINTCGFNYDAAGNMVNDGSPSDMQGN